MNDDTLLLILEEVKKTNEILSCLLGKEIKSASINQKPITKKTRTKKELSKKEIEQLIPNKYSDEAKNLILDWCEIRKCKKSPNTKRAIELNINKLDDLARQSRMSIEEYLSEVICKCWAGFYAINSKSTNGYKTNDTSYDIEEYEEYDIFE